MALNTDVARANSTSKAILLIRVLVGWVMAVLSQMQAFAIGTAITGRRVYYGVVDGGDISGLASAYPQVF
jgi:hypothetical protein